MFKYYNATVLLQVTHDAHCGESTSTTTISEYDSTSMSRPHISGDTEPNDSPCVIHEDNEASVFMCL